MRDKINPYEYISAKLKHVVPTIGSSNIIDRVQAERDFYRALARYMSHKLTDDQIIKSVDGAVEYLNLEVE